MPFFSFSLKDSSYQFKSQKIENNNTYFSKNINLWNLLCLKKSEKIINFLNYEKRKKIGILKNKILFCLPPKIGLGDAIEYGLAIQAVIESNIFKKIAVAFSGEYSFIFENKFNIKYIYPYIISKSDYNSFENIFHFTFEIEALKKQKYLRSDIAFEICKYFNIPKIKYYNNKFNKNKKIKKISIFPISNSPIRTMPFHILEKLLNFFKKNFIVEVYFDKNSEISNYLLKKIFITYEHG